MCAWVNLDRWITNEIYCVKRLSTAVRTGEGITFTSSLIKRGCFFQVNTWNTVQLHQFEHTGFQTQNVTNCHLHLSAIQHVKGQLAFQRSASNGTRLTHMFHSTTIVPDHELVVESPKLVDIFNLVLRLGVRVSVPSRSSNYVSQCVALVGNGDWYPCVLVLPRKDVVWWDIGNCRQKQRKSSYSAAAFIPFS